MNHYGALFTYSLAIPILVIPLFILIFMPKTISTLQALEEPGEDETPEADSGSSGLLAVALEAVNKKLQGAVQHIRCDILPMLMSTVILRGLFGILVLSFSESSGDVLLQYMRVRFGWRYEEVYKPL